MSREAILSGPWIFSGAGDVDRDPLDNVPPSSVYFDRKYEPEERLPAWGSQNRSVIVRFP